MRTSRLFWPIQEKRLSARHRSSSRVAVYQAEGGPGQEEGALLVEDLEVERRHGAARGAEEDHVAAGPQAVEAAVEGVLADGVVDDVDALAVGDALRLLDEVLLGVEDHLIRPGPLGELSLLLGPGGPDHGCARASWRSGREGARRRRPPRARAPSGPPGGEGAVRQVWAVIPWSITAAAILASTKVTLNGTSFSAGATTYSA